jgi:trimeric autotransporter adhesin
MIAWGDGDNVTLERYQTPAALAAAKNSAWVNAQTPTAMSLAQMSNMMTSDSSVAVPLPSDVAQAIGQSTGVRHLGTFP